MSVGMGMSSLVKQGRRGAASPGGQPEARTCSRKATYHPPVAGNRKHAVKAKESSEAALVQGMMLLLECYRPNLAPNQSATFGEAETRKYLADEMTQHLMKTLLLFKFFFLSHNYIQNEESAYMTAPAFSR